MAAAFDLRSICAALGSIELDTWFKIGVQLGVPHRKLMEFKRGPEPLAAVIDYWLKGNVTESVVPISWKSIVDVLKSEYVGEPGLAEQISQKYCLGEGQSVHYSN